MTFIQKRLVLYIILIVSIVVSSCGSSNHTSTKEYYEKAKNSNGANILADTNRYLIELVRIEQVQQGKNPKRLNIALLEEGEAWASKIFESYANLISNETYGVEFGVNYATIFMLEAAYYESRGEISAAVEKVSTGIDLFEELVFIYPEHVLVRGYRAMSFVNLPDIFEKYDTAIEDFTFAIQELQQREDIANIENEVARAFFPIMLRRAKVEFKKSADNDMNMRIDELLQKME